MNMHSNIPTNQVAGGASNMTGMHMSPTAGAMMPQQQSGSMMQQQSGSKMQQQQTGTMMQQQSGVMMQQSQQQIQVAPGQGPSPASNLPQLPPPEKMDDITKVKTLMGSYRECVATTLKSAAQDLHQNHAMDSNSQKGILDVVPRFDKNLEEFFSLCDQMELHLRTAVTCIQQAQTAAHYLPLTVIPSRLDPTSAQETTLSYPSFLSTVRLQISYAKDIHDTLVAAAQNIALTE